MSATDTSSAQSLPKPKKSVALSGVIAGNTALCTVGRTGNDLHYRGYDIIDLAEACAFEEVAHSPPTGRRAPSRCRRCPPRRIRWT